MLSILPLDCNFYLFRRVSLESQINHLNYLIKKTHHKGSVEMILANFLDSIINSFKVSDDDLNQEDQSIQIELIKTSNYRCGQDISDAPSCAASTV